jgi:hypothetical protein
MKKQITAEEFEKKFKKVKCNCRHYMKDHFLKEGCCFECGCTWYWPNDKFILKLRGEK